MPFAVGEDPRNAGKSQPCAGRETDGMCGNGNGTGLKLPLRQMWFKKRIAEGRERSDRHSTKDGTAVS